MAVAHAARRFRHQRALVVPVDQLHVRRQPRLIVGQRLAHAGGDRDVVRGRLLVDRQLHRRRPVLAHADPLRHDAVLHLRQVADAHDPGRPRLNHRVPDLGHLPHRVVQRQQQQLVVVLHAPDHGEHVRLAEHARHVRERQAVHGQAVRVHQHLHLALLAALHADIGHARDRGQQRHELVFRDVAQGHGADRLGHHGIGDHRIDRRVHPPHLVGRAGRQGGQHLRHRRIHLHGSRDHVGAPVEIDRGLRRAAAGRRAQVHHAQHPPHRALERDRHQQLRLAGRARAGVHVHHHAGELHHREQPIREQGRREHAGQSEGQQNGDDGAGMARHEVRRPRRLAAQGAAASRTAAPSCNW